MAFLVDPDEFLAAPEAQPPSTPQTTSFRVSPEDFLKSGQEQPTAVQSPAFHISPEDFLAQPTAAAPQPPAQTIPGMERLGGTPPGAPRPPLPGDLNSNLTPQQQYESIHGEGSSYTYNRFGERIVKPELRQISDAPGILSGPFTGPPKILEGAKHLADALQPVSGSGLGSMGENLPDAAYAPPSKDAGKQAAGALTEMIGGAMETAEPLAVAGGVVAPLHTALTIGASMAAEAGARGLLNAAGVDPAYAGLAGSVAGLLAAGEGGRRLLEKAYTAAGSPEVKFGAFDTPKEFRDMTDEELVAHANSIERDPPKNYDWQRQEVVKEVMRRVANRGVPNAAPDSGAVQPFTPTGPTAPPAEPAGAPEAAPGVQSPEVPQEQTPGAQAPIVKGSSFETSQGKITISAVTPKGVLYSLETPEGKSLQRVSTEDFQQLIHPAPPPPAGQPAQGSGEQQPGVENLAQQFGATAEPQPETAIAPTAKPSDNISPESRTAEQTQIATGKEPDVALQDFVSGRGGFGSPARMVIRSGRDVTPDEIRSAFFPDLGPDQLQIQKLRADLGSNDSFARSKTQEIARLSAMAEVRDQSAGAWAVGKQKKFEGKGIQEQVSAAIKSAAEKIAKASKNGVSADNYQQIGSYSGIPVWSDGESIAVGQSAALGASLERFRLADFTNYAQKIHNIAGNIETRIEHARQTIERLAREDADMRSELEKPWAYQKQFEDLVALQKRLAQELGAEKGDDAALGVDETGEVSDASVQAQEPEGQEDEEEESPEAEPEDGAKAQPFLSLRKLADKATNSLFPRAIYKHGVIWVNSRTMEHVGGIPAGGVHLSRNETVNALENLEKNPGGLGLFPRNALMEIKKGLKDAIENNHGAILVHHTPGSTLSELKAVVRHEEFHRNEPITGAYSKGVELLKNPLAKLAAGNLSQRAADRGHPEYYRLDDPAEMWSEIGAHLAGGPAHWDALGLDYDQAKELWRVYLKLWHPDDLAHIKKITPLLNGALHAARAQADIRRRGGDSYSPVEGSPGKWDVRPGVREAVSAPRKFSLPGEKGSAAEETPAETVARDWPLLAREADEAPDESLLLAYKNRYAPMLSEIQGREGVATNLRQLADSLHSEGDAETLRAVLSSAFGDAAEHSGKWSPSTASGAPPPGGKPPRPPASAPPGGSAPPPSGGTPNLANTASWLQQRFGSDGPRANYSGLGALRSRLMPGANLSQLEAANKTAHTAALRAASSRAQAATILRAAVPPITRALEGSGISWAEMRLALIESRLQGLRDRWRNFADQMGSMSDQALHDGFDDVLGLVKSVEGKQGLPQDLAQTASSMIESGSDRIDPKTTQMKADQVSKYYAGLRTFLQQTFEDAADAVTTAMPADRFEHVTADPKFQRALETYKKLVEGPMAKNHALNEGIFSTALGPLDAYYPLIPLEKGVQSGGPGRRLPYHKPRNMANAFATGLSEAYDPDMEAFKERLSRAIRANDKAAYLRTLEEQGLLQPVVPGQDHFVDRQGKEWEGERVEIAPGRTIFSGGKAIHTPAKMGIMPRWLNRESRPLLEGQPLDPEVGNKIIRFINTLALSGPADFVFHSANVLGSLVANTPFLGTALSDKALSLPLIKKFGAIFKVLATDPTTEESAADLIEMAKLGIVPSKYASTTLSRAAADQLGAEYKAWRLATIGGKDIIFPKGFSPMLYGPKGLDIRARLFMYRLAREINPEADPQQLHHFVNILGNYVPELQSSIERSLKSTGWSPFFTAGSTMIRNGINAWTGAGPMPKDGASMRAWQQLTGGALATVALWYVAYKLLTGKDPTKDKRVKFLQFPVGNGNGPIDRFRHSAVGNELWGKGPEVGYLNFGFFNPLVSRGARALGLPGALETRTLGGTIGQQIEAGQRDILNSFAHPVLGPLARSSFVGITGDEPYLTDLRDRGQMAPRLMPAVPPQLKPGFLGGFAPAIAPGAPKKNPGFMATEGAKSAAALRELNAFYGNVGENTGMLGPDKGEKGDRYLRMIVDLTMPGLVSNASNPYARMKYIQQNKKAMQ